MPPRMIASAGPEQGFSQVYCSSQKTLNLLRCDAWSVSLG